MESKRMPTKNGLQYYTMHC